MSKIELHKIIHFDFDSQARDVGKYTKKLKILRRSPRFDAAFITTKAGLTGGLTPLTRGEMLLIDAIATLHVYIIPVNNKGEDLPIEDSARDGWVDKIVDQDVLFALHKEWIDYQNSFYPEPAKEVAPVEEGQDGQQQPIPTESAPQPTV